MMKMIFMFLTLWAGVGFSSFSAMIKGVKNDRALIDLEGMKVRPGELFEVLNLYGRTMGRVRIEKTGKGKAIGVLVKGRMDVRWILEPTPVRMPPSARAVPNTMTAQRGRGVRKRGVASSGRGLSRSYRGGTGGVRAFRQSDKKSAYRRGGYRGRVLASPRVQPRYKKHTSSGKRLSPSRRPGGASARRSRHEGYRTWESYDKRYVARRPVASGRRRGLASVDSFEEVPYPEGTYGVVPQGTGGGYSFQGLGTMVGMHFNSIRVTNKLKIRGLSWRAKLLWDTFFLKDLGMRVGMGYQTLVAKGSDCGSRISKCHLRINYPFVSALLRAVFLKSQNFNPWAGAGAAFFWPLPDRRYDLGLDQRSFNSIHGAFVLATGVDIHFERFYIPVQLDLNWINPVVVSLRPLKERAKEFKPFYIGVTAGLVIPF